MTDPLSRHFDKHWPDALAWFEQSAEPAGADDPARQLLAATKQVSYIEVPDELLMDWGLIPDTREHKPVPRRTRLRWRLGAQRERAAELAYRMISGHDVPESDY